MAPRSNTVLIQANTDTIRELEQSVATLYERIEGVRGEIASLSRSFDHTNRDEVSSRNRISGLTTQLARLDERLKAVQENLQKTETRRWTVVVAILTALLSLGVSLTVLIIQKLT